MRLTLNPPTSSFWEFAQASAVLASLPPVKSHLLHAGAPHPSRRRSLSFLGLYRATPCPHPVPRTGCGGTGSRENGSDLSSLSGPSQAGLKPFLLVPWSPLSSAPQCTEPPGRAAAATATGHAGPGCPRPGLAARTWPSSGDAGGTLLALRWCRRAKPLSDRWPGCPCPSPPLAPTPARQGWPKPSPQGAGGCRRRRRPPGGPGPGPVPRACCPRQPWQILCAVPRSYACRWVVLRRLPGKRVLERMVGSSAQHGNVALCFSQVSSLDF